MNTKEVLDALDRACEYIRELENDNRFKRYQLEYLINQLVANNILYRFEEDEGNYPSYWIRKSEEIARKRMGEIENE